MSSGARGERGRGRGRGRNGGRGRGNRNHGSQKNQEKKFFPHSSGKYKQTFTYQTVKEDIEQKIQRTFMEGLDMVKSLQKEEYIDIHTLKPIRLISNEKDEDKRKILQEGYDMEYKSDYEEWKKRLRIFETNKSKAYALIYERCNVTMQHRVEEHPDYESKIRNDPIELLKAIKVLMHDPVRARYPFASLVESLERLINMKQGENEGLIDYTKRYKQARDVFKSHTESDIFDKFMEHTKEYKDGDAEKKEQLKKGAFEQFNAYLYIRNADQAKYGSLTSGWRSQFSMGNDQYPRNLSSATDILSNHRFDNSREHQRRQGNQRNYQQNSANNSVTPTETSFAQANERTCYCCGERGHIAPQCPRRNEIPRDQWAANRGVQHLQDNASVSTRNLSAASTTNNRRNRNASETNSDDEDNSTGLGWSGAQIETQFFQDPSMKLMHDEILLDTGSTMSLFANRDLVTNVRTGDTMLSLATNTGTKTNDQIADVPNFGQVWFAEWAIANIFGFQDMKKRFRITYDSSKEDAFHVHMPQGTVKFTAKANGLYTYQPSEKYREQVKTLNMKSQKVESNFHVSTVAENRMMYTTRQFERAKRARSLYHALGAPTIENFKHLIRMNAIKNNPVTVEDITIAEKIFGPDVATLKGKSTRPRNLPTINDEIAVPPEIYERHHNIELCMDTMFVNGMPFLTAIDKTIKYRSSVPLENKLYDSYYEALDKVLRFYNKANFRIKKIQCDREYAGMMDKVKDELEVEMNYTNAQDHVPEAERNNRTIKERVRTAHHRLPYKVIPKIMIRYLVMESTRKLNLFPVKGGVSTYYSPQTIMTNRAVDYEKECTAEFGAYVQASNETTPTNDNVARTIDGIYLRPTRNQQGGHEFMNLTTGQAATRRKITVIPVTRTIITTVEKMAERQGIKSLKFTDRQGRLILDPDADWFAGVDEQNNTNDTNDDDDEGDEDYIDEDTQDEDLEDTEDVDISEIDDILQDGNLANNESTNGEDEPNPNEHQDQDANIESDDESEVETQAVTVRRSNRARETPERMNIRTMGGQSYAQLEQSHNLVAQGRQRNADDIEYNEQEATVISLFMIEMNQQSSHAQQFLLKQGLKLFGERGHQAVRKEIGQMHKRVCFMPKSVKDLTREEMRKAVEALMFLTEKRDGTIKGRQVYNGKPTRQWLTRQDSASPTACLESLMILAVIDCNEGRHVEVYDVPNAFIQTPLPIGPGDERVMMKITGVLIDHLIQIDPELYGPHVVFEKGRRVLYVQVLRAIYGMLQSALLWYKKFRTDLEENGFKFNPYDPCVANKIVFGKQQTIRFHVDDLMASHEDPRANRKLYEWLVMKYGDIGEVAAHRGDVHDYLGMIFHYDRKKKTVEIDMQNYVKDMLKEFPIKFGSKDVASTPAADNLYIDGKGKRLDDYRSEVFHKMVAKGLFICKRG